MHLTEALLMSTHNKCFHGEIRQISVFFSWKKKSLPAFAKSFQQMHDSCQTNWNFLAGQNKILQDRRLVSYQITVSFCQKSQDICQTNWTFLPDRMKMCRFCQTVLQFSQRLVFTVFLWPIYPSTQHKYGIWLNTLHTERRRIASIFLALLIISESLQELVCVIHRVIFVLNILNTVCDRLSTAWRYSYSIGLELFYVV